MVCTVMSEVSQVNWVALTGDFWTSTAVDSYLGITTHFTNEESHTAVHVAESLQLVVQEWVSS